MADLSRQIADEPLKLAETVSVPTRVYFPAGTFAPDVTPGFDAAWTEQGVAVSRKLIVSGRKQGTAAASVTATSTATNPEKHLHGQYVSPPLQAQTISGSIRGQFRALESATGANATLQIGVRVVSHDGATVRATLLAVGGTTTTTSAPPEFATSLTNRILLTSGNATPLPLASYTCIDGDRLVIEIGSNDKSVSTSQTIQVSFGDNTLDLPENDTTTTAQDPWVEFNSTITFTTEVDTLRVIDSGTTELIQPGGLHLSEGPVVAAIIEGGSLSINLGDAETVHVVDQTPTGAVGLSVVVPAENVHVVDTVWQDQNAIASETIKVADVVADVQMDMRLLVTAEDLKIADTPTARFDLTVVQTPDALIVADSLTVTITPVPALAGPEGLTLAEGPATGILDLTVAAGSEAVKVSDGPVVPSILIEASVSESLVIRDSTSQTETPLATAVAESVRILDQAATPGITLFVVVPPDSLKIADSVVILSVNLTEGVKLGDIGRGQTSLIGTIRISDGPVITQLGSLLSAGPSETIKIVESLTRLRLPIEAAPIEVVKIGYTNSQVELTRDEYLAIGELLAAALVESNDLSTFIAIATIRIADAVSVQRDLETALSDEVGTLADGIPVGLFNLYATASESLIVADTASTLSDALASVADALAIADTAAGQLDPEQASASELIRFRENLFQSIADDTDLTVALTNMIRVTEAFTVRMDLATTPIEAIRIQDTLTREQFPRDIVVGESIRVRETTFVGGLTPLLVFADEEEILIGDDAAGVPVIQVAVDPEVLRVADPELTLSLDLSTDVPPTTPPPTLPPPPHHRPPHRPPCPRPCGPKTLRELRADLLTWLGDAEQAVWTEDEVTLHLQGGYDLLATEQRLFWDWTYLENLPRTFSYTQPWERVYLGTPGFLNAGQANYTAAFELGEGKAAKGQVGPATSTSPFEGTDGWDTGPIPAVADVPKDLTNLDRVTWDSRGVDALDRRTAEAQDQRYEQTTGEVYGFLWRKDGVRAVRKVRVPAAKAETVFVEGVWGILRNAGDVDGATAVGTWGSPRIVPTLHPIGSFRFGTARRIYQDGKNVRVEHQRLGRPLERLTDTSELPCRYTQYLRDYALGQLLERAGPGQDLVLAKHFQSRWERDVARIVTRLGRIQRQRVGVLGGDAPRTVSNTARPKLPWPYGSRVR